MERLESEAQKFVATRPRGVKLRPWCFVVSEVGEESRLFVELIGPVWVVGSRVQDRQNVVVGFACPSDPESSAIAARQQS